MGGHEMSKCNKKPEVKDSFWSSQVDYNKTASLTYETLIKAADKIGGAAGSTVNENLNKLNQYYQTTAYIKGKQWIDFNDIGPTNMSGPPPTSAPSTYEPPSEPKSMRDIYKHAGREKKPELGDCAPHPQAGIPVTDTGDWPYNKVSVELAEKIMADLNKPSPLLGYFSGGNVLEDPINSTQYYTNYKMGIDMAISNPAKLGIIEDIKEEDE